MSQTELELDVADLTNFNVTPWLRHSNAYQAFERRLRREGAFHLKSFDRDNVQKSVRRKLFKDEEEEWRSSDDESDEKDESQLDAMAIERREDTIKSIKTVLVLYSNGLTATEIFTKFSYLKSYRIRHKPLGFDSLEDMLKTLPDIDCQGERFGEAIWFLAEVVQRRAESQVKPRDDLALKEDDEDVEMFSDFRANVARKILLGRKYDYGDVLYRKRRDCATFY
ncbi:hypothetical protein HDE_00087 [Halotydeus destructor]|nr:hypothetical protein HDE_00087 [Halotydeus destructor]